MNVTYLTLMEKQSKTVSHCVVVSSIVWVVRLISLSRSAKVVVSGILPGRGSLSLSMRKERCKRVLIFADSWNEPSSTVPTMVAVEIRRCVGGRRV